MRLQSQRLIHSPSLGSGRVTVEETCWELHSIQTASCSMSNMELVLSTHQKRRGIHSGPKSCGSPHGLLWEVELAVFQGQPTTKMLERRLLRCGLSVRFLCSASAEMLKLLLGKVCRFLMATSGRSN